MYRATFTILNLTDNVVEVYARYATKGQRNLNLLLLTGIWKYFYAYFN